MLSARLILVRHGQSTHNAQARLQGQADPPLSDAGRAEAELLRPALPRFDDDRVVTSDLRTRERDRGAARLPGRAPRPALARDRRRRVGGPPARRTSRPDRRPAWRGGPLKAPDGESWADLQARVGARAGRADRGRRDVARGLPRRRGARRALARHRCRPAAGRRAGQRERHGRARAATRRSSSPTAGCRFCQRTDARRKFTASSPRGAALEPQRRAPRILGPFAGARRKGGNRPAGNMGPPCRSVTPLHGSRGRSALDALQPRGADPRARPLSETGAGAGAVSRRNCSIAAITAAASSGDALEPCSSRRGRRFMARRSLSPLYGPQMLGRTLVALAAAAALFTSTADAAVIQDFSGLQSATNGIALGPTATSGSRRSSATPWRG